MITEEDLVLYQKDQGVHNKNQINLLDRMDDTLLRIETLLGELIYLAKKDTITKEN